MLLREAEYERGIHQDITGYGGWRAYRAAAFSQDERHLRRLGKMAALEAGGE